MVVSNYYVWQASSVMVMKGRNIMRKGDESNIYGLALVPAQLLLNSIGGFPTSHFDPKLLLVKTSRSVTSIIIWTELLKYSWIEEKVGGFFLDISSRLSDEIAIMDCRIYNCSGLICKWETHIP